MEVLTPDKTAGIERPEDRLISAATAAELLGCSVRTIWRLRAQGVLEGIPLGHLTRFRMSQVRAIIREGVRA